MFGDTDRTSSAIQSFRGVVSRISPFGMSNMTQRLEKIVLQAPEMLRYKIFSAYQLAKKIRTRLPW